MNSKFSVIKFSFDRDRRSSLVLILGEIENFDNNKFLKKYYDINNANDEGETQGYFNLSDLKCVKKNSKKFSFGFDYVLIKAKNIKEIYDEFEKVNVGEIWFNKGSKYDCIADFSSNSEQEICENLKLIYGDKNIGTSGVLMEVVLF